MCVCVCVCVCAWLFFKNKLWSFIAISSLADCLNVATQSQSVISLMIFLKRRKRKKKYFFIRLHSVIMVIRLVALKLRGCWLHVYSLTLVLFLFPVIVFSDDGRTWESCIWCFSRQIPLVSFTFRNKVVDLGWCFEFWEDRLC